MAAPVPKLKLALPGNEPSSPAAPMGGGCCPKLNLGGLSTPGATAPLSTTPGACAPAIPKLGLGTAAPAIPKLGLSTAAPAAQPDQLFTPRTKDAISRGEKIICQGCSGIVWRTAERCPTCDMPIQQMLAATGGMTPRERARADLEKQQAKAEQVMTSTPRDVIEKDDGEAEREANEFCVLCMQRIPLDAEYCPLDERRPEDGPKVHEECWEAFAADPTARCSWCFKPVTGGAGYVPTTPRDGFKPAIGKEIDPTALYGMHGNWGRAQYAVAQGGAIGGLQGAGKRVLHQQCVDKYNEAKGKHCLWCKKAVHLGMEIEGRGVVHKGFCHVMWLREDEKNQEEQRIKDEEEAVIAAEKALHEYVCGECGTAIEEGEAYYEMDDEDEEDEAAETGGEPAAEGEAEAKPKNKIAAEAAAVGAEKVAAQEAKDEAERKRRTKLKVACWEKRNKCICCGELVTDSFYKLEEGKLHESCWEAWREMKAPKCIHCGRGVVGKFYPLEAGRLHIDCWEGYQLTQGGAEKCHVCKQAIIAEYYEVEVDITEDEEKVMGKIHIHCWDEHKEREKKRLAAEAEGRPLLSPRAEAGQLLSPRSGAPLSTPRGGPLQSGGGGGGGGGGDGGGPTTPRGTPKRWFPSLPDRAAVNQAAQEEDLEEETFMAAQAKAAKRETDTSLDADAPPSVQLQGSNIGWMYKRGHQRKNWKRRWGALRAGCLCYFTDESCKELKGSIPLYPATIEEVTISARLLPKNFGMREGFELTHANGRSLLAFPEEASIATLEAVVDKLVLAMASAEAAADDPEAARAQAALARAGDEETNTNDRRSDLSAAGEERSEAAADAELPAADDADGQGFERVSGSFNTVWSKRASGDNGNQAATTWATGNESEVGPSSQPPPKRSSFSGGATDVSARSTEGEGAAGAGAVGSVASPRRATASEDDPEDAMREEAGALARRASASREMEEEARAAADASEGVTRSQSRTPGSLARQATGNVKAAARRGSATAAQIGGATARAGRRASTAISTSGRKAIAAMRKPPQAVQDPDDEGTQQKMPRLRSFRAKSFKMRGGNAVGKQKPQPMRMTQSVRAGSSAELVAPPKLGAEDSRIAGWDSQVQIQERPPPALAGNDDRIAGWDSQQQLPAE